MTVLPTLSGLILITIDYVMLRVRHKILLHNFSSTLCQFALGADKKIDNVFITLGIVNFPHLGIGNNFNFRNWKLIWYQLAVFPCLIADRRFHCRNLLFLNLPLPLVIG